MVVTWKCVQVLEGRHQWPCEGGMRKPGDYVASHTNLLHFVLSAVSVLISEYFIS
jgi:hypothetical protein